MRRLLERIRPDHPPSVRVAHAPSQKTAGLAECKGESLILGDVLKDDMAGNPLRGMAAAVLVDNAWLGRTVYADLEMTTGMYATARKCGRLWAAHNIGVYCEGHGEELLTATSSRTAQKRHRLTSAAAPNAKCADRPDVLPP